MASKEQEAAIAEVVRIFGWDHRSTHDLGLMLWVLFRYYARRAADDLMASMR